MGFTAGRHVTRPEQTTRPRTTATPTTGPSNSHQQQILPASPGGGSETPTLDAFSMFPDSPLSNEERDDRRRFLGDVPARGPAPAPATASRPPARPARAPERAEPPAEQSGWSCEEHTWGNQPGEDVDGGSCVLDDGLRRGVIGGGAFEDSQGDEHGGAVARMQTPLFNTRGGDEDSHTWMTGSGPSVFAGVDVTTESTEMGAQIGAFGGDRTVTTGQDEHSQSDSTFRLGAGVGVGAGIRFHYDDADQDGFREIGLGIDAGPISMDLMSELFDMDGQERLTPMPPR